MKVKNYKNFTVAVIGSHSALDVCRGAKDEGLKTLVVVEKGRDKTYADFFKSARPSASHSTLRGEPSGHSTVSAQSNRSDSMSSGPLGCVDEVVYVEKFKDILSAKIQNELKRRNCIFIPHRSFEVYVNDHDAIENNFKIPIFGNRYLLRFEERNEKPNQYDLLEKAGIKFPKIFKNPKEIDRLVIVKVQEKQRGFERSFFLASSPSAYNHTSARLVKEGKITKNALQKAVIEEFILGVQVNFNFFFSSMDNRLELIGTDTRRQTNLDGLLRLPAGFQEIVLRDNQVEPKYEEAGHIAMTVLESLLEQAFEIGERFVKTAKEMIPPGVIGPFGLQSVVTPGPPKKEIIVFDVSPRMPGSPGISSTPYSGYLYGKTISI